MAFASCAALAQSAEHFTRNEKVKGSIPLGGSNMSTTTDLLLEIFTWIGVGGAFALVLAAIIMWAADGSWLPAEAIVDRDGDEVIVRWFDGDGDANSATLSATDAATLAGRDVASIWYSHGWQDRMRLTRRPSALRVVARSAAGMLALAVLCQVVAWVLYFVRG